MKKVIYDNELRNIMNNAVNMICNAVSKTFGTIGNNVLINNSDNSPFITNDGATIARNIESDDKAVNTILEIVKEASLKTNEDVGDGTTSTLVLLQSIFNQGIEEINRNRSPMILKKELNEVLEIIINQLNKMKKKPNKKDLESVATISSNDKEIGTFLTDLFIKMKTKYSIKLKEGKKEKTYYELKKGYSIEIDEISNIYFSKEDTIKLKDTYVLIIKGYLSCLEDISEIINEALINNKKILIFVEDMDESIKSEILNYYISNNSKIFIFKLPYYAIHRDKIEKDIVALSNCKLKVIGVDYISISDFGIIDYVTISKNEITLVSNNNNIKKYIKELKKELASTTEDYEKEFIESRLSKLQNGIAIVYVCGVTKTEIKEKLMRYEDALCSLQVASDGILIGEGLSLLEISEKMKANNIGESIIKKALQVPFEKIMNNASVNSQEIKEEIIKSNYRKIFNIEKNEFEDITNTNIIDPLNVVIESLKNSISIASILLTTDYLVINENEKYEKEYL